MARRRQPLRDAPTGQFGHQKGGARRGGICDHALQEAGENGQRGGESQARLQERETPNADASRTPDNDHWAAKSTDEAMGRLRELLPEKRRKDAVLAVEYVLTASP